MYLRTLTIFSFSIICVNARPSQVKELRPLLMKSVVSHSHPETPPNNQQPLESSMEHSRESDEDNELFTPRKIYHIPRPNVHHHDHHDHHHHHEHNDIPSSLPGPGTTKDPDRGQILHRPKSGNRNNIHNNRVPPGIENQGTNSGKHVPHQMIINGKGKKVQYHVPNMGFQQGPPNSGPAGQGPEKHPPQVYVITSGDEDEDKGVMGSMQNYFKSMTGKIRAAFQGLIGGITD